MEGGDAGCLATARDACVGELWWSRRARLRRSGYRVCKRRAEDRDLDAGSTQVHRQRIPGRFAVEKSPAALANQAARSASIPKIPARPLTTHDYAPGF